MYSAASLPPRVAGARPSSWTPPILQTVATENRGIDVLWNALRQHREHLDSSGEGAQRRRQRIEAEVIALVQRQLQGYLERKLQRDAHLVELLDAAAAGQIDPHTAAARIWAAALGEAGGPTLPSS